MQHFTYNHPMSCIFCKIVNKEIPANIVYEDNDFMAFLDINPLSPGHTLVIPKQHYRWVWDVPAHSENGATIGKYYEIVQKIALAHQKAFDVEQIISKVVGEDVHHAHVWIFPSNEAMADKKDFEGNAEKIRRCLI